MHGADADRREAFVAALRSNEIGAARQLATTRDELKLVARTASTAECSPQGSALARARAARARQRQLASDQARRRPTSPSSRRPNPRHATVSPCRSSASESSPPVRSHASPAIDLVGAHADAIGSDGRSFSPRRVTFGENLPDETTVSDGKGSAAPSAAPQLPPAAQRPAAQRAERAAARAAVQRAPRGLFEQCCVCLGENRGVEGGHELGLRRIYSAAVRLQAEYRRARACRLREWLEEERSAEERAARAMQTAWRGLRFRRVTMQARVCARLPEVVRSAGNSESPPLSQLIVELRRRRAILWLFARAEEAAATKMQCRRVAHAAQSDPSPLHPPRPPQHHHGFSPCVRFRARRRRLASVASALSAVAAASPPQSPPAGRGSPPGFEPLSKERLDSLGRRFASE